MFPPRPTELLHTLLRNRIADGDLAIDATAGNGHDTVFLAKAIGETGKVIAIDIQAEAIASTRKRLDEQGLLARVALHFGSHADLEKIAGFGTPSIILFNLGYLPGGDHSVITRTEETLTAIAAAADILRPGGTLAVTCYPGHPGGVEEARAVEDFIASLQDFRSSRYGIIGTEKPAPFLLLCGKTD